MKPLLKALYRQVKNYRSRISISANISMDSDIGDFCSILKNSVVGRSRIGAFSYVGYSTQIQRTITGPFCSIGPEVLCGLGSHPTNYFSTYPGFYSKGSSGARFFGSTHMFESNAEVLLGADVWLGARCIVLGGVKIGTGAIIAAGAVVTKDVEAYAIMGGVPAKRIRYRFDPEICLRLCNSKWWELSIPELVNLSKYSSDVEAFLQEICC